MKRFQHASILTWAFRFKHTLAATLALTASVPFVTLQTYAGTTDTFNTGASLIKAANYASGKLPTNVTDVNVTTTNTALTFNGGTQTTLSMESLSITAGTLAYTLANTSASTTATLTLGNGAGFTNANDGVANDLIALTSGASLTLTGAGTGTLALTLASSGNFDNNGTGTLTITSNIGQSGAARTLTITGTGTDSFTGTNSFSGGLVITNGELDVSSDASLGAVPTTPTADVTVNGGRLGSNSGLSFTINANRTILLGSATGASFSVKGAGDITYNGSFQDLSTGGILVKQGAGILDLGGTSTYTGATSIGNGEIRLNGSNLLPTGTVVNLGQSGVTNLGTFDLNGNNQQIAGLNSIAGTNATAGTNNIVTATTGNSILTLAGTGTYAYGDGSTTNSGNITDGVSASTGSGVLALVKSGSGTQTLGGSNTYTGGTTVNGGSLVISNLNGSSATGSGAVTVYNSGSLLGAGYINAGANKVTINGTLSPGAGTGSVGTITVASTASTGALTLSSTSTLAFDITNTTTKDDVELSGSSLALNGGKLALNLPNTSSTGIDYTEKYALFTDVGSLSGSGFGSVTGYDSTDYTAKLTLNGSEYDLSFVAAVPEPATVLGGALMVGLLGVSQRRRIAHWMRLGV